MKESEAVIAVPRESHPSDAACACLVFLRTPARSYPKRQREGLKQEISVGTRRGGLLEGEYLLSFGKTEHVLHRACRLTRGNRLSSCTHSLRLGSPGPGDGSGDAVKK